MTFEEFVKQKNDVPADETEPFCPFGPGFCDQAYTDTCYDCYISDFVFENEQYGIESAIAAVVHLAETDIIPGVLKTDVEVSL